MTSFHFPFNTLTWRFPTFWADGHLDPNLFFFMSKALCVSFCYIIKSLKWIWEAREAAGSGKDISHSEFPLQVSRLMSQCYSCYCHHFNSVSEKSLFFFFTLGLWLKIQQSSWASVTIAVDRSQWKAWIWAVANSKCFLCCSCVLDLVAKWLQYLKRLSLLRRRLY